MTPDAWRDRDEASRRLPPERDPAAATPQEDGELGDFLSEQLPRLTQWVRAKLGAKLRRKESVSDIVQSAAREVLEDLHGFPAPSLDELRGWLYRAAERKLVDKARYWHAARRSPGREQGVPSEVERDGRRPGAESRPSGPVRAEEARALLADALQELSPEHREVILLSRVLELPHRTISQLLGRGEGATRMLLVRALASLSEHLASSATRDSRER